MINTDQSDYIKALSNVSKYLSYIFRQSNGLRNYSDRDADLNWYILNSNLK